jgi:hypothetical protein
MSDEREWTRAELLAEIDRCLAFAVDDDQGGDPDGWVVLLVVRTVALLRIARRFLAEDEVADGPAGAGTAE